MGTSASSSGPNSRIPLVPPWVPEPDAPQPDTVEDQPRGAGVASSARFATTRRHLSDFAKSGERDALRRGIASYVGKGLGGSQSAARRMAGAAKRSGELSHTLRGLSVGTLDPTSLGFETSDLLELSTREILDKISRFISPSNGTQDAESSQRAVNAALSDLLESFPDADLTSLTAQQIDFVLERHIVIEIVQRIELDVGKSIIDKAASPAIALDRLNDVREYVKECVAAAFRKNIQTGRTPDYKSVCAHTYNVIQETFNVFEEYIK